MSNGLTTPEPVALACLINDNTHRFTDGYDLARVILAAGYVKGRAEKAEAEVKRLKSQAILDASAIQEAMELATKARDEVLAEAIERIESLAGDYANGGHALSWEGARHCVESLRADIPVPVLVCDCYPGGFTPDSFEGPKEDCPVHGREATDANS